MMSFMLILISLFIMNFFNNNIKQFILQNMLFLVMFMYFVTFPMSNYNFWLKIYYNMGYDYYSWGLNILSLWILGLMVMVSVKNFMLINSKYYMNVIIFIMIFLFMSFVSMNYMMFYLFFESSLIPVFLLIMGWGYQVERIEAGISMMLYTMFGSLPLFYFILIMYKQEKSMMFMMLDYNKDNLYSYSLMIMAFLIKMPMYMLHLWLPKAHVEAPLVGSMILAGVMLKLGSYGLMRFMMMMMMMCMKYNIYIIGLSLWGGLMSSLICLNQVDMKKLVAYSSVVHMSILLGGILTMSNLGYFGGMLMMVSHGLCSSGLFCLVNINYERLNSRSLFINKGMINIFPSLTLMWFLLCSSNLSFPPSLNLFGEIILLMSLIIWSKFLIIILMLIMFFSASYSLYLYSFSQHGKFSEWNYMNSILVNEYIVLLLHWIPLNILFTCMYIYL